MSAREILLARLRAGLSVYRVRLPEKAVRAGTTAAALFNIFGMALELLILRHAAETPRWPELFSMAAGLAILFPLATGRLDGRPKLQKSLFVLNAACVSIALCVLDGHIATAGAHWTYFQATKLGALVAGMLAPGFVVGLVAIAIHVGATTSQFLAFPPELQARLGFGEPWPTLAFGLAGACLLLHRLRVRELEEEAMRAFADAEATRRVAHSLLEVRDRMNSPLQSIELATTLLDRKKADPEAIRHSLERSCASLRELNHLLKHHEAALDWSTGRGGLGVSEALEIPASSPIENPKKGD